MLVGTKEVKEGKGGTFRDNHRQTHTCTGNIVKAHGLPMLWIMTQMVHESRNSRRKH